MVDVFNLPGALKIANPTHLAHRADQNKQTNPNIWNGHNGAVSLLTYTHFIDILLLDVGVQKKYMTVQNLICDHSVKGKIHFRLHKGLK